MKTLPEISLLISAKILAALDGTYNDISDLEEAVQSIESDRNRLCVNCDLPY